MTRLGHSRLAKRAPGYFMSAAAEILAAPRPP